jgi:hypothetical protein
VQRLGYDVEILDFYSCAATHAEWRVALRPTQPLANAPGDSALYKRKTRKFGVAFDQLPLSKPFPLEQPELLEHYHAIIVGSDEVWNLRHPWFAGIPTFFGAGLPCKLKISYAASFGNYSCWEGIGSPYTDLLREFDALSVRDENSWWMLKNSIGLEVPTVLDPCLQFPASIAEEAEARAPYALVYGHNFSPTFQQQVHEWSRARGCPLLSVGYRNDWAESQRLDAGPLEFAAMAKGASCVVTNFFHGCVFALLNGKPFAAEVSPYRSIKIRGLMELLGGERHLVGSVQSGEGLDEILGRPPSNEMFERLSQNRTQSLQYLQKELV